MQTRLLLIEESQFYEFALINQLVTANCKQPLVMNTTGDNYLNAIVDGLKNDPDMIRQQMPESAGRSQVPFSILQQTMLCKRHDARTYINRIYAPTLIMSGLQEPVVTCNESKLLASAINNIKKTIFLDCGHMLQRELPHKVAKELLEFLHADLQ